MNLLINAITILIQVFGLLLWIAATGIACAVCQERIKGIKGILLAGLILGIGVSIPVIFAVAQGWV
jgi:hypothetical protein